MNTSTFFSWNRFFTVLLSIWMILATVYVIYDNIYPYMLGRLHSDTVQVSYGRGYHDGILVGSGKEAYQKGFQAGMDQVLATGSGNATYKNGYDAGYIHVYQDLHDALQKQFTEGCKRDVPVSFGSGQITGLFSTDCLKAAGLISASTGSNSGF